MTDFELIFNVQFILNISSGKHFFWLSIYYPKTGNYFLMCFYLSVKITKKSVKNLPKNTKRISKIVKNSALYRCKQFTFFENGRRKWTNWCQVFVRLRNTLGKRTFSILILLSSKRKSAKIINCFWELIDIMKEHQVTVGSRTAAEIIATADTNHDGHIDFQEFLHAL